MWSDSAPIVVFGDDWGRHVSTLQHLFRHVAQQHPVVWINAIGHRVPTLSRGDFRRAGEKFGAMVGRKNYGTRDGTFDVGASPTAIIDPRVLPWHHWPPVHRLNTERLVRTIRVTLSRISATEAPILVTGTPPSAGVVGRIGERAAIYFCMDDFLHLPDTSPKMLAPLEQKLLSKVDAVVATAAALEKIKRPATGRTFHLPQGVNWDHLSKPRAVPADLAALPRPIVGFAGGLFERCDLALIEKLARAYPSGSVALIGPVAIDLDPLRAPNIHIMGTRPYTELPAYVQAFDVGIVPYILNDETRSVDPLKVLEYMAAGIPVVCTALPEAYKYDEFISIARTHEDFLAAVQSALAADRLVNRRRVQGEAKKHTWEVRASKLLRILREVVEERARSQVRTSC